MRRYSTLLVTGVVVLSALLASACSGDSNQTGTPAAATPTASAAALATTSVPAGVGASTVAGSEVAGQLAALSIVDAAGFHAMDEAMNGGDGKINPQWLGKVRHGQTAVASVSWPTELTEQAKAFVDAAEKLAAAIEADDAKAAAPAAEANHDAWHELTTDAWEALAKSAGIKVAGHAEATATPTATATATATGR